MKKTFALVLIPLFAFAASAMIPVTSNAGSGDNPPPAYAGWSAGWGNCFENWERSSGGFNSGTVLYRPDPSFPGGAGWMVHVGGYVLEHINYEDIWIKLWIQLYVIQTYDWSLYEIHRMFINPGSEDFDLVLSGTVIGNHPEWVLITNFDSNPDNYLEFLHFINNVAGYTSDERDIPVTWRARTGDGLTPGTNHTWPGGGNWSATITPEVGTGHIVIPQRVPGGEKWYQFLIEFTLNSHEPDGYYALDAEGCPNPDL